MVCSPTARRDEQRPSTRTRVPEHGAGVCHARVQEQLVHVIAGVVVLCNVAAGAEECVGSGGMG